MRKRRWPDRGGGRSDPTPEGAPIHLPPTRPDLATARIVARHATLRVEQVLKLATCLADERAILAGTALFWAYGRLVQRDPEMTRRADHLLGCALVSAALPHLIKRVVDRKRPDRTVVHGRRHGIPRSGKPMDSFPSGHALHLGALAMAFRRMTRPPLRPIVWPAALSLASTRVLLLAHYPTDVAAGLALGVVIDRAIGKLLARWGARAASLPRRAAPGSF